MTDQEINEAVARKLGWTRHICEWLGKDEHWHRSDKGHDACWMDLPDYCHSIAATWGIWEKLRDDGYDLQLYSSWDRREIVCFHAKHKAGIENQLHAESESAPMSLCLAFLKLDDLPQV